MNLMKPQAQAPHTFRICGRNGRSLRNLNRNSHKIFREALNLVFSGILLAGVFQTVSVLPANDVLPAGEVSPVGDALADSVLAAGDAVSVEFRPVNVWTDAETVPGHDAAKMADGDFGTYAELLDDTRTGGNAETLPPNGSGPVTALFVLDFGKNRSLRGLRMTAQKSPAAKMAETVTVFTCTDAQGKTGIQVLAEHQKLHPVIMSHPAFITWDASVETRYLGVKIENSYERDNNFPVMARNMWFQPAYRSLQAGYGFEVSGTGNCFLTDIAEVSCFSELPSDLERPDGPEKALTPERLFRDWLYQDSGSLDVTSLFASPEGNDAEQALVTRVISELPETQRRTFTASAAELKEVPGTDSRWKELYIRACAERRRTRLAFLLGKSRQILYTRHTVIGGGTMHGATENLTDTQYDEWNPDFRPGGELCLMTLHDDGTVTNEVLYEVKDGFLRDPALSYDGKTIAFSMRKNLKDDNFHLYRMDAASRQVTQITFDPVVNGETLPVGDTEPCFLPDGNLMFQSTRCVQVIPCWKNMTSNLYTCAPDGSRMYRVGFDQANTFYPQVQDDGRVIFTRWEYNDKNSSFQTGLFSMNPDGTSQQEYYGNTSYYPVSLLTARGIPGSHKAIAVISGHYVLHKGKLVIIDNHRGMEEDAGIEYVGGSYPSGDAPGRKMSEITTDKRFETRLAHVFFGQFGPQYQYPWAFDEEHYLTGFLPEGSPTAKGPYYPGFGIYFMTADGTRELLAYDPTVSCGQPVPFTARPLPPERGSMVNHVQAFGRFYIQNVYVGAGLKGVPEGTVKKLRVAALEYRPCLLGGEGRTDSQSGEPFRKYVDVNGSSAHDIVSLSGAWDVKHVLGEVDVESDGSCFFEVPANNPVYFQMLDEKGRCVQSMRSWTVLMPGEQMACVGCHEDKNQVVLSSQNRHSQALTKPAQKLAPIPGMEPHPLLARLETEGLLGSANHYLGVNAARECDAPRVEGFSFTQNIQPILDRHCVRCHDGSDARTYLRLTGEMYTATEGVQPPLQPWVNLKYFSQSYISLTHGGRMTDLLSWYSGSGISEVLPPCAAGSTQSRLMEYLEPTHYGVQLSDGEKRIVACWIDLSVPYAGSYSEHNIFPPEVKDAFRYHMKKREALARQEVEGLRPRTPRK